MLKELLEIISKYLFKKYVLEKYQINKSLY